MRHRNVQRSILRLAILTALVMVSSAPLMRHRVNAESAPPAPQYKIRQAANASELLEVLRAAGEPGNTPLEIVVGFKDGNVDLGSEAFVLKGDVLLSGAECVRFNGSGEIAVQGHLASANRLEIHGQRISVLGKINAATAALTADELLEIHGGAEITVTAGADGGALLLAARTVIAGGRLCANGARGGEISFDAQNVLVHGAIVAEGLAGKGGKIAAKVATCYTQTEAALISANGSTGGGSIELSGGAAAQIFSSGQLAANGALPGAQGGRIHALGNKVVLAAAHLEANGASGGGTILIGGDFQGKNPAIYNAQNTIVTPATAIHANATGSGHGGKVIVWSDGETSCAGTISARGGRSGGDGGIIEASGKANLAYAADSDADASNGKPGTLLLDPKNLTIATAGTFPQFQLIDPTPAAGDLFGVTIVPLSTGNIVVTDPNNDTGAANAGAVHLFNGRTGALISTLLGSQANDQVGSDGVTALTGNGNYVVRSPLWDNVAIPDAGAATWCSGTTGLSGTVSILNSLVGSTNADMVGKNDSTGQVSSIVPLTNGNYVVVSYLYNTAVLTDAGAVTWGNGTTGVNGTISVVNSFVGATNNDMIGLAILVSAVPLVNKSAVTVLPNGNYVVTSLNWDNGGQADAGAVTWGNGATGAAAGVVGPANSLVGSTLNDKVGNDGIVLLTGNNNYLVRSSLWNNGGATDAGAVTWASGTAGVSGVVSAANSLVGSTNNDLVGGTVAIVGLGGAQIALLSNGNYVVSTPNWQNNLGAATWGNGAIGISGAISAANSLVGSAAGDLVASYGVTALANGNYVVNSPDWANGGAAAAGAVTWANGATGLVGTISAANSLVGTTANDRIGISFITELTNGNYVTASYQWTNGGFANAGAVTWCNGLGGTVGPVSAANSLVGSSANDSVGNSTYALQNGNYVVVSSFCDNGATVDAGAITWGNGATGTSGIVSVANSLMGGTNSDRLGVLSTGLLLAVNPLPNGNYVVCSPEWDNGAAADAGAVTLCSGTAPTTGLITVANSLIGTSSNDLISKGGVRILTNGNYVVISYNYNNGAATNAGAVTWCNGSGGTVGPVSPANSLVGSTINDQVGYFSVVPLTGVTIDDTVRPLANGNYVVRSKLWDNGAIADASAITWGSGTAGVSGPITAANSLVGSTMNDALGNTIVLSNGDYIVQSAVWDNGGTADAGAVILGNGSGGTVGPVTTLNSIIGGAASTGLLPVVVDTVNNIFLAPFNAESNGKVRVGPLSIGNLPYGFDATQSITVPVAYVTYVLNNGTNLVLQASNDLTVSNAITANNPAGNGGALTLQAGRSVLINADITTDNGDLTIIANDNLANGVIDSQRDTGAAAITMAVGTTLNTGTGTATLDLRAGTGKTNATSGDVTLRTITAANTFAGNSGTTASSATLLDSLIVSGALTLQSGKGTLAGGTLTASSLTLASGSTLAGQGTVACGVTAQSGATVAPGDSSISNLVLNGNLTFTSGSTYAIQLGGTAAGASDKLTVTGNVDLGGATISASLSGYTPADADTITILDNDLADAVTGTFSNQAEGSQIVIGGKTFRTRYAGGDGNDVQLSANSAPTIVSAPTATPSTASVGQTVIFSVGPADVNNETLTYSWSIDGTVSSDAAPAYAFSAAGVYTVSVTVTDTAGETVSGSVNVTIIPPVVGTGVDTDGDGFSDAFEISAGTSPSDAHDSPNGGVTPVVADLTQSNLGIKLNFAKPFSDSIAFKGVLPVPANYSAANQTITLDVGGVIKVIRINTDDKVSVFKLAVKSTKGAVAAQSAKYSVKLAKGNFSDDLADNGLINANVVPTKINLVVRIVFNGTIYEHTQPLTYSAKLKKSGMAKVAK